MKYLLAALCIASLCSCTSTPTQQTSFSGQMNESSPTDPNDPRLRQRQFYLDGDDIPTWMKAAPQTNQ